MYAGMTPTSWESFKTRSVAVGWFLMKSSSTKLGSPSIDMGITERNHSVSGCTGGAGGPPPVLIKDCLSWLAS